jgi:hypothetical protein
MNSFKSTVSRPFNKRSASGGETKRGWAGKILRQEVHRPDIQMPNQCVQVLGNGGATIANPGRVGGTKAAKIEGKHPVRTGQDRDELVEGPPGFGPAMHQHNGRAGATSRHIMQPRAIDRGEMVGDFS